MHARSVIAASLLAMLPGAALADGKLFTDSRDRFQLSLPPGWELTPRPGDTEGMCFRRKGRDIPANLCVRVDALSPADNAATVMGSRNRMFERDLGYDKLAEAEVRFGDLRFLRRVHTAAINGDLEIKRYSVDHVLLAYGFAHYVHLETREGHYPEFSKDLESILKSYIPIAGRKLYQPLIGRWQMAGAAQPLDLTLAPDQYFTLGNRTGLYRVDGRRLILTEPLGQESYKYTVQDDFLTLQGDGREAMSFRRGVGGPGTKEEDSEEARAKGRRALKVTRELVVGSWVVVEGGDSFEMVLAESGSMRFGPMNGRYELKGNLLTIESVTGVRVTYHLSYDGKRLRMTGGDLDKALVMERRQ